MDELQRTGEAGMHVLLDEIRQAPTIFTSDATLFLADYRPAAIDPLIQIAQSEGGDVQYAALSALYDIAILDPSLADAKKIRNCVTPMVNHPRVSIRSVATLILRHLDRSLPE